MNWFILAIKRTFDFKGRSRRREYGWFILLSGLLFTVIGQILNSVPSNDESLNIIIGIFSIMLNIAFYLSYTSLITRRLHDLGHSGWWQLLPIGLLILSGIIFFFFGTSMGNSSYQMGIDSPLLSILVILCFLFIFIFYYGYLLFKSGNQGENKYGKAPK